MPHYHIRWSSEEVIDWEAFPSSREAEAAAAQLVRRNETYTIEEHNDLCPRCRQSFSLNAANPNPAATYPWQQSVFDVLNEPDARKRMQKLNVAQRAISARLISTAPADLNEQAAIRDAL